MGEAQTSPVRVLVVDNSADIRDVISLALDRQPDFELVASAHDGETGVAAAAVHQPDLVLLDIAMPDMDGLQALPLIRSASPRSIVVMLTGLTEQVAAIEAVEHGAHGYIRKGSGIPELLAQMREVVAVKQEARRRPGSADETPA